MCETNVEAALDLNWDKSPELLLPAVIQDSLSGRILMLGYMNESALAATVDTGWVTLWSRSRDQLWTKGATSGNRLRLDGIETDCDRDTLLVMATPQGPTCHRGTVSCFDRADADRSVAGFLGTLEQIIRQRRQADQRQSYTARLLSGGMAQIARKVGEEAVEVVVSAHESAERSIEESADLLYHLLVFLSARDIELADVLAELKRRHEGD